MQVKGPAALPLLWVSVMTSAENAHSCCNIGTFATTKSFVALISHMETLNADTERVNRKHEVANHHLTAFSLRFELSCTLGSL